MTPTRSAGLSLRARFVLALMLTGLASVALVGGIAWWDLQQKFASTQAQRASAHFRASVLAYLERHGTWEAGPQDFGRFMRERRLSRPDGARPDGAPPDDAPGHRGRGDDRPPPPERRDGPPDGAPPRDAADGRPPFRFILADENFRVLLGAGIYPNGEPLPQAARAHAQPVEIDGRVRAWVSTEGVLSASPDDLAYLAAMREALLYGVAAATVLAVAMGLVLGGGLSAGLRRLTEAVQAMRRGELRQRVEIDAMHGGSEVALLGEAFNAMSAELAASHESLQRSNETIAEQAQQLKEQSIRDALTGLYNRRHFDESARLLFEQALRHRRPLCLVVSDIDWFKRINDNWSHATGDAVLRQVAAILRANLRASDLLARYGGEEFVIALPETDPHAAAALCDKLRLAIAGFNWNEIAEGLAVTMSFGLSADLEAGSAERALDRADAQLYRAKGGGRNKVCFA